MHFSGATLRKYRSIGSDGVDLRPWQRCNLIVGQNNSGKSNVIRAFRLALLVSPFVGGGRPNKHRLDSADVHGLKADVPFEYSLWFRLADGQEQNLASLLGSQEVRFDFRWRLDEEFPTVIGCSLKEIDDVRVAREFINTLRRVSPEHGVRFQNLDAYHEYVDKQAADLFVQHFARALPRTELLPEFRQIRPSEEGLYKIDGTNLVAELSEWESPEFADDRLNERFLRIQFFLRQLLHLPDAVLSVTAKSQTLMLQARGLRLPLSSYGTGTHELVVLLTAILHDESVVFCMEEPEVHLHPRLQRELVRFLVEDTSASFLMSSHSATLINADFDLPRTITDAIQVFHIAHRAGTTSGSSVAGDRAVLDAVHDLGVRPSDLLQSNAVIWVEGPSDRHYLRRWLELTAPDLKEGLHYSIMFYGGRLLAHLSLAQVTSNSDDSVPVELIAVLRINQKAVVVMDRDRDSRKKRVNETKRRVSLECSTVGAVSWTTHGREIENYLSNDRANAVLTLDQDVNVLVRNSEFGRFGKDVASALRRVRRPDIRYDRNKVEWARRFMDVYEVGDLGDQLRADLRPVVSALRRWNDLDPSRPIL